MTIRVGSLFAGYDGLGVALNEVFGGVEIAWYSEIEKSAIKIMEHHHPGVPNLGDITEVNWEEVAKEAPVDILTGGFP